ncbi:ADA15 protein, partial [Nyctibius grandis]|nr:ADA15 protein [Nyctibius grandis]
SGSGSPAGDSGRQRRADLGRSWHVTPWVLRDNRTLSLAEATQSGVTGGGCPCCGVTRGSGRDLVPGAGTLLYYLPDGTRATQEASEREHCCYRGTARGVPGSWANLCACAGLSGHLRLSDTRSYGLEPDAGSSPGRHVAYRLRVPRACGQDPPDPPRAVAEGTEPPGPQRGKRAAAEQRFVELVMVVDHAAVGAG